MDTTASARCATLAQLPFDAAATFGDLPALRSRSDGTWHDLSYDELAARARALAHALVELGVDPGDRVAILAETRAEWTIAQLGIAASGAATVPIYPTNSPDECAWVLRDSGSVAVICENAEQVAKVRAVHASLPELRRVVTIDSDGEHPALDDLIAASREQDHAAVEARIAAVAPDSPAVIIYTSGTTGNPKGCVLTHQNFAACVNDAVAMGILDPDDVTYLFLPLAHVFAQVLNIDTLAVGGTVAYVSDGPTSIIADLGEVRPTIFPSVPRIFEKVHALFAGAEATKAVHDRARAVFGGRIRFAISGAAPISPEILEFFHEAGVPIFEGYGLSESTASGTLNRPDALRIGSIGRALPSCAVRVADDGEILLGGPLVFAGYWQNAEATSETLTEDGWLRTGDLGAIDADGFVTITGRKKDIIITAGGKNLTPSTIENELRQHPLISYALMHGDRRPYPVALLTLDPETVGGWAAEHGLPEDPATLAEHPRLIGAIQAHVDEVNARHATVGQIKRFAILARDFSQPTGELTPTLKMRRAIINEMYADVLDGLYSASR